MPVCTEFNKAMQELTGVKYNTGEQNKDMTKSRQAQDWKQFPVTFKRIALSPQIMLSVIYPQVYMHMLQSM